MQVSVKDAELLKQGSPAFGGLSFDWKYEPSDEDLRYDGPAEQMATYTDPALPLHKMC